MTKCVQLFCCINAFNVDCVLCPPSLKQLRIDFSREWICRLSLSIHSEIVRTASQYDTTLDWAMNIELPREGSIKYFDLTWALSPGVVLFWECIVFSASCMNCVSFVLVHAVPAVSQTQYNKRVSNSSVFSCCLCWSCWMPPDVSVQYTMNILLPPGSS